MNWKYGLVLLLAASLAARAGDCIKIIGDRITARDFAQAAPTWQALQPDVPVAYGPRIGVRRVLNANDVIRLQVKFGLAGFTASPVCFERASHSWTKQEVEAVLARESGLQWRVVDYARRPTPPGELHFPAENRPRSPASGSPEVWRGYVQEQQGRQIPFWIRVASSQKHSEVLAAADLLPGAPISSENLMVRYTEIGRGLNALESPGQAIGRLPRRLIRQGQVVLATLLIEPKAVERGQLVQVQVETGGATMTIEAHAQAAGRTGDVILLRNPVTSRFYKGTITSAGRALVRAANLETK